MIFFNLFNKFAGILEISSDFKIYPFKKNDMLIIEVKDNESIDRALKRYKRKYQSTKVLKEIRERKEYVKPSVKKRSETLKAVYREKRMNGVNM